MMRAYNECLGNNGDPEGLTSSCSNGVEDAEVAATSREMAETFMIEYGRDESSRRELVGFTSSAFENYERNDPATAQQKNVNSFMIWYRPARQNRLRHAAGRCRLLHPAKGREAKPPSHNVIRGRGHFWERPQGFGVA